MKCQWQCKIKVVAVCHDTAGRIGKALKIQEAGDSD